MKADGRHFLHKTSGRTEYLTPKFILDALGPFDLDPCASEVRPWPVAKTHYTEDGLTQPWRGLVFLNPPYGSAVERRWVAKLAEHGNGVALLFVKAETRLWQEEIFPLASGILFLKSRISFCNTDGTTTLGFFGASALIAYGARALSRIRCSQLEGYLATNFMGSRGISVRQKN